MIKKSGDAIERILVNNVRENLKTVAARGDASRRWSHTQSTQARLMVARADIGLCGFLPGE